MMTMEKYSKVDLVCGLGFISMKKRILSGVMLLL